MFELIDSTKGSRPAQLRLLHRLLLRVRPALLASLLKRTLRIKRTVVSTAAGDFLVDPVSGFAALLSNDAYEKELEADLRSLLFPGATFVDVGANEGYFSVIASKLVGANGRVVAIEPQSRLQEVLTANFKLNGNDNVHLIQAAISDRMGTADLHLSPDTNTGSTGFTQSTTYRNAIETAKTTTLARLLHSMEIDAVDVMKVDIEGLEFEAIVGSPELFKANRVKALALELHPREIALRGHRVEDLLGFLTSCGYHLNSNLDPASPNTVWLAPGHNLVPVAP